LLPAAYQALDWIDRYVISMEMVLSNMRGVLQGLANQSWKDSWDANMRPDGTLLLPHRAD